MWGFWNISTCFQENCFLPVHSLKEITCRHLKVHLHCVLVACEFYYSLLVNTLRQHLVYICRSQVEASFLSHIASTPWIYETLCVKHKLLVIGPLCCTCFSVKIDFWLVMCIVSFSTQQHRHRPLQGGKSCLFALCWSKFI